MLLESEEKFFGALCRTRSIKNDLGNILGQSIVHFAVLYPRRLEALLEAGMDYNTVDKEGSTPLMYAAAYGLSESVVILLKFGASQYIQDARNNRLYLDYAVRRNHQHVILDAVRYVREQGCREVALAMLDRCAHYHLVNGIHRWMSNMLKVLFAEGADPDSITDPTDFGTAMHLVQNQHEAHAILAAPSEFTNVNETDRNGLSPLMIVVGSASVISSHIVNTLIDRGASINHQDHDGWTALMHLAAGCRVYTNRTDPGEHERRMGEMSRFVACVNLLLKKSANATIRDHCQCPCSAQQGCSLITIALHGVFRNIARWGANPKLSTFIIDVLSCMCLFEKESMDTICEDIHCFTVFEKSGHEHSCCRGKRYKERSSLSNYRDTNEYLLNEKCSEACVDTEFRLHTDGSVDMIEGVGAALAQSYTEAEAASHRRHEEALKRKSQFEERVSTKV